MWQSMRATGHPRPDVDRRHPRRRSELNFFTLPSRMQSCRIPPKFTYKSTGYHKFALLLLLGGDHSR